MSLGHYREVHDFLVNLIREGYKARNKTIYSDEAYQVLRIVWGRTKQLQKERNVKWANKEKRNKRSESSKAKKKY